jgi:hypothetical protein
MLTVIVALLYAGVIAFDFVPQAKRPGASKKSGAVYLALVLLSLVMLLLYSFNISVPSPIRAVLKSIEQLFQLK